MSARAPGDRPLLARMRIVSREGAREQVVFSKDEPKPGEMPADGYDYRAAGVDAEGGSIYWREPLSHQARPVVAEPPVGRVVPSYGTFSAGPWRQRPLGGQITPNPSKFFPQQAAIDMRAYGAGRLIDASDVSDLVSELQLVPSRLGERLSKQASAIGAVASAGARSLVEGGDAPSLAEEEEVREPLLPKNDDPRVVHYLLLHGRGDLVRSSISLGVSLLSGGISSMVEKGGSALAITGLGTELQLLAGRLRADNLKRVQKAHKVGDLAGGHPDDLIAAIETLALHYGASSVVEGAKAIPFYIGSAIGFGQKGVRAAGSIDNAKSACKTIRDHASMHEEGAVAVAGLLGIPLEVIQARDGQKVMYSRL